MAMTTSNLLNLGRRSKIEHAITDEMFVRGVDIGYESLTLDYVQQKTYKPDFILPNGIVVEVKGYFTPNDRAKLKAVRKCNPAVDVRLVFERPHNKLNSKSHTTYAQWCDQNDFKWAEKTIPVEWLHEKDN